MAILNRLQRREAQRYIEQESAKWPAQLKEWPRDQWPTPKPNILKVWRSRKFLVQEWDAPAPAIIRLSILRTGLDQVGGWLQGISWDELQGLKREAGYGDHGRLRTVPLERRVMGFCVTTTGD